MAETPEDKTTEETPETTEAAAETPETLADEVANAAEGGRGDERSKADAAGEGAGDATTADAGEDAPAEPAAEEAPAKPAPKAGPTRREKLEERRAARRAEAGKRPSRTPEERDAERRAAQPAPEPDHAPEHGPGRAKVRQGVVVSDKADKTIVVRIDTARRHRRYRKIMRTSVTLHAHDERNDAHAGDTVRVQETRPMSRTKRWRLLDVVERAR